MHFSETPFKGLYVINPDPFEDERGLFFRTFCKRELEEGVGLKKEFVQSNQSINFKKGTFRGLHYNNSPEGDDKLIRCIKGSVFDVLVDLRENSKSFLNYFSIEISAKNRRMLFVPSGFAHGFITLEDNTELVYSHTSFYNPAAEMGINVDDPRIGLSLPLRIEIISQKDRLIPFLKDDYIGYAQKEH